MEGKTHVTFPARSRESRLRDRFEDVEANPDWNPGQKMRIERLIAEKVVH